MRLGLSFPKGNTLWPGGDLEISGRLEPAPENPKDWWVRAEGVFLHASREAPILESGAFAIGGLEMGAYLVTAFEGKTLRYAGTIEIDPKGPKTKLTIPVPARGR